MRFSSARSIIFLGLSRSALSSGKLPTATTQYIKDVSLCGKVTFVLSKLTDIFSVHSNFSTFSMILDFAEHMKQIVKRNFHLAEPNKGERYKIFHLIFRSKTYLNSHHNVRI